jgi:O-antigen chain-terminating methyltransferase
MSDGFYRAFEDQHRGSRELIKTRQRAYLPFIDPLKAHYPDASALDLGCGRGEWLELLTESGFKASGVDLDDGMLAVCRERGMAVQTKDAVTALQEQSDASLAIVSGFHLAEHIPFEALQSLISESLRALKPAGLLILETPNPENIVVGTANFYLDPTHRQPIPPLLLSFLAEYCGFARVKVIRLQAPVDLNAGRKLNMHDVLGGVSPDYAIVAQKAAPEEVLRAVSLAFEQEYGVTLGQLSGAYDQQIEVRLQQTADLAQQAMTKAVYAEAALDAIYASSSWRVTRPLRWLGDQVSLLRRDGVMGRVKALIKKALRPILALAISFFDARPDLRARHSGVGGKKGLYDKLSSMYLRISPEEGASSSLQSGDSPYAPILTMTESTPHARQVYVDMIAELEKNKGRQ